MKSLIKSIFNALKIISLNIFSYNKINKTASIHLKAIINSSSVGDYTYVGPNAVINNTIIGNYCSIAPNVVIGGMEHDYTNYSTSTFLCAPVRSSPTHILDDVWIGTGVYVRAGIKLGKGCVIGSNSTVLSDVPPLAIVVGSPAKIVKYRFSDEEKINFHSELDFTLSKSEIKSKIDSRSLN